MDGGVGCLDVVVVDDRMTGEGVEVQCLPYPGDVDPTASEQLA